jgi:hypothetical protein
MTGNGRQRKGKGVFKHTIVETFSPCECETIITPEECALTYLGLLMSQMVDTFPEYIVYKKTQ